MHGFVPTDKKKTQLPSTTLSNMQKTALNFKKHSTNKKTKQLVLIKDTTKLAVKARGSVLKKKPPSTKGNTMVAMSREVAYALVKYYNENCKRYKSVNDFLSCEESNLLTKKDKQKFSRWRAQYATGKLTKASSNGYRN